MSYTCAMDPSNGEYTFPEFSKTVSNTGEVRIYSKVSHMFKKLYERLYSVFRNIEQVSKVGVKTMGK